MSSPSAVFLPGGKEAFRVEKCPPRPKQQCLLVEKWKNSQPNPTPCLQATCENQHRPALPCAAIRWCRSCVRPWHTCTRLFRYRPRPNACFPCLSPAACACLRAVLWQFLATRVVCLVVAARHCCLAALPLLREHQHQRIVAGAGHTLPSKKSITSLHARVPRQSGP